MYALPEGVYVLLPTTSLHVVRWLVLRQLRRTAPPAQPQRVGSGVLCVPRCSGFAKAANPCWRSARSRRRYAIRVAAAETKIQTLLLLLRLLCRRLLSSILSTWCLLFYRLLNYCTSYLQELLVFDRIASSSWRGRNTDSCHDKARWQERTTRMCCVL